jgi:sigma-E factor negative regulatory protein RseA
MNEHIHEQLSALMDGELERDQARFLLKRLASEAGLPLRWERYHLVRQTLRRQEVAGLPRGFADAVMARLDAEPALRAGAAHGWLRWGAGGAIAASVAVAALVLTRPAGEPATTVNGLAARTASQPAVAAISAAPVAATTMQTGFQAPLLAPVAPVDSAPASFGTDLAEPIAIDPRLQSYLIRHYQAAGAAGQSNFVPYVLLAQPQRETLPPPVRQQNR